MMHSIFGRRATRGVILVLLISTALVARAGAQAPSAESPVIARVQGRPVTQADFDRLAQPYFAQLRGQYGGTLPAEVARAANQTVLDELIRRELLVVEFERRGLTVSEGETDVILRQDPYFLTGGRFDEAKFRQFKVSPGSNYLQVLPRLREMAGATKVDGLVRNDLRPSSAQLRAEWSKRNDQARLDVLTLGLRETSLEPEATAEEQRAFYEAHPERFERKPRIRLRHVRLVLPPEQDPGRAAAESAALARALELAVAVRAGASLDSIAGDSPAVDTGPFDLPVVAVPGLGREPALIAALATAAQDSTARVIGPLVLPDAVLVGEVHGRTPRELPPFAAVRAEARRLADQDKRRALLEEEKRAHYAAHPEPHRAPRMALTRVTLAESRIPARWPSVRDIERWYQKRGAVLFPSTIESLPPLSDSLRGVARERLMTERRVEQAMRTVGRIASVWARGRDPHALVRGTEAVVETLSVFGGLFSDSIFTPGLCDSLLRMPAVARLNEVQGPRHFFGHVAAWRVTDHDTAYTQPYDLVHLRVEQLVQDERRAREEREAEAFFEAHRERYKTPDRYALDVVAVRIPPPDSVTIADDDLRRAYRAQQDRFREEAQVRARHILLSVPPGSDTVAVMAMATRADSLRAALLAGASFEALAAAFSQDPGSASRGGDLGFFGRGRMVKAFEDTSFALAPGALSQPVRTQFGFHLIRVEESRPERVRPFEEVRAELHRTIGQSRGDSLAKLAAARLRRELARGADPAGVAAGSGGVQSLGPVAAGEPVGTFGIPAGLAEDLSPGAVGRWLRKEYRVSTAYLVVKPTRHAPPGPASFTEVKVRALDDWRQDRRREILDRKVAGIRERLAAGEPLDSVAAVHGGLRELGPVLSGATAIPLLGPRPGMVERVFAMKEGAVSDSIHTAQGVAWIRVRERGVRQGASFEAERDALASQVLTQRYADWVTRKRRGLKIEILRPDLR